MAPVRFDLGLAAMHRDYIVGEQTTLPEEQ